MCTLYERIQELCKNKGVSGSRMCLDLGLSKSTLSDIKNGRKKGISVPTAQKIATYFDISVDELYGENEQKNKPTTVSGDELSDAEHEFIKLFRLVPEQDRDLVVEMVRAALRSKGLL